MPPASAPQPFCPECGQHPCVFPDPAMHRPKRRRLRDLFRRKTS